LTKYRRRNGFSPRPAHDESDAIRRAWAWFRYIVKGVDPQYRVRANDGAIGGYARSVFGIRKRFVKGPGVYCTKLAGCSENISYKAQRAAGFVSAFAKGEWGELYDEGALEVRRRQRREEERRREDEERRREIADLLGQLEI
jgi:hypothetical protein